MSTPPLDAIVIGAGHNGLACAIRLAKAGKKVLVVEQRPVAGGLCAPRSLEGGYTIPGVLHDTREVRPGLCDSLGLFAAGLKMRKQAPPLLLASAEGKGFVLAAEGVAQDGSGAGSDLSEADNKAYADYQAFIQRVAPVLSDALNRSAPSLSPAGAGELFALGLRGLALRRLGKADMTELLRVMPMAVADWMRERFSNDHIAAGIASAVLPGNWVGPWSPGTAANLLLSEACRGPGVEGGAAALVAAEVKALENAGGKIRFTAEVEQILVDKGVACGVQLASGETVAANLVASATSPKRTLLDLCGPGTLPAGMEKEASNIRSRGMHAKIHLGLKGELSWHERKGESFEHIRTGEHLDDLERAFDASKYRRWADKPVLDITIPSLQDPALAPDGHHVASIIVSCAPYDLEIGWNEDTREALLDAVLEQLNQVAPGASEQVVVSEVLSPVDLEEEYGLPGGNLFHVEHALDQLLFLRPSLHLAHYATPIPGLWLCGAGSHPGGGVTLAPGSLAAQAILAG